MEEVTMKDSRRDQPMGKVTVL